MIFVFGECNVARFDSEPHYRVRIAPHIDAGLVLCGLLALDKLESVPGRPSGGLL